MYHLYYGYICIYVYKYIHIWEGERERLREKEIIKNMTYFHAFYIFHSKNSILTDSNLFSTLLAENYGTEKSDCIYSINNITLLLC
jgi:hypothetical protein